MGRNPTEKVTRADRRRQRADHDPPSRTIQDDRGVERPLWHFPQNHRGVPPDCPMPASEQRRIERALGIPWWAATPMPSDRIIEYGLTALLAGWGLVLVWGGEFPWKPLFYGAMLLVLSRAALQPGIEGMPANRLRALAGVLLMGVLAAGWLWVRTSPDPAEALFALIPLVAFLLIPCLLGVLRRTYDTSRSPRQIRVAMTARGRCPSCAYPLADLPRQTDLCVVCAHCGGAWRVGHMELTPAATTCPTCAYSLLGLPPRPDGVLQCPECAQIIPTPGSSGESPQPPTTGPRCTGCGAPLAGLPIVNGDRVRCPNCGQWRSGLCEADLAKPSGPAA